MWPARRNAHDRISADGKRGAGAGCAARRGEFRHRLSWDAVHRGARDRRQAQRRHDPRRVGRQREGGARGGGRRVHGGCARARHDEAGGPERRLRSPDDAVVSGLQGRAGARRGRRPRPHIEPNRAGHARVRAVRQSARARPGQRRRVLRHRAGCLRDIGALRHARDCAADDAGVPRLRHGEDARRGSRLRARGDLQARGVGARRPVLGAVPACAVRF